MARTVWGAGVTKAQKQLKAAIDTFCFDDDSRAHADALVRTVVAIVEAEIMARGAEAQKYFWDPPLPSTYVRCVREALGIEDE